MVKLLLEREDTNLDTASTKYGTTPLSWTTVNRHGGVMELLLAREVPILIPSLADGDGHWGGGGGLAKLLMGREDINSDT